MTVIIALCLAAIAFLVLIIALRKPALVTTNVEVHVPVTISFEESDEAARKRRALAYAQRMGNSHNRWGGAVGR